MIFDPTATLGSGALEYIIKALDFNSAIDVGCGFGKHSERLKEAGKSVTSIDITGAYRGSIAANYMHHDIPPADLVWVSHCLEHQLNVHDFLKKCRKETNEGGYIVIVVPPAKHPIVGGHLSIWNAGLVMYNLVLAGYDCSNARIKQYGYNIMVVAEAKTFTLPPLRYDYGDIETLQQYLPNRYNTHNFDGNIKELNTGNTVGL